MRALALFSGGLDSMLSVKLIKEQGVDVVALFIDTGFGSSRERDGLLAKRAETVGAKLEIIDTKEQFIKEILFDPRYGYGKNFNPCIDCHANMIKIAKALLPKYKADFIITGEVAGQRPMSQRVEAIQNVTRLADEEMGGVVIRPLSAKLFPPTKPEIEGWIDREKLLAISGRDRKIQLDLAKKYNFEDYENPGGGCLLTEAVFSAKIRDHIKYDKFESEDVEVLKTGRHLRLPEGAKLVIGRNKEENERIAKIENKKFIKIRLLNATGPLSLLSKNASKDDTKLAVSLALVYGKTKSGELYEVKVKDEVMISEPFVSKEEAHKFFIKI